MFRASGVSTCAPPERDDSRSRKGRHSKVNAPPLPAEPALSERRTRVASRRVPVLETLRIFPDPPC